MIKQKTDGEFRFRLSVESRVDLEQFDLEEYYDTLIVPQATAPVLRANGGDVEITPMRFSLLPSWSKEPRVKLATHNARLESIDEKPTWRTVFVRRHCLVPMTHFIEPIYKGEHAGFMVAFFQKEGSLIYAAGVWDQWVNKQTGEVIASFAIITHDPPPFIRATGHDRCPLFLEESASGEWLHNHNFPASTLKSFLTEHQESMDFSLVDHRPMRPGWEKRK